MRSAIILAILALAAGCDTMNGNGTQAKSAAVSENDYLGYQPIDPVPAERVRVFDGKKMVDVFWASCEEANEIRSLLPLQCAQIAIQEVSTSGAVKYLTDTVAAKTGTYTVIMDYMKYRVDDVLTDDGRYIGNGRTGVGLRIKATVHTNQANLNLASLMAIGLEAERKNLSGSMCIDIIGIDSADVTNLVPLTSEIDQTAIQAALQALASIKTKVFDDATRLTPHLVAIRQAEPNNSGIIRQEIAAGVALARTRIDGKRQILALVAPKGSLDKAQWDKLVDACGLADPTKRQLKELTDLNGVNERLDVDAAMNGTVIAALGASLRNGQARATQENGNGIDRVEDR